MKNIITLLLFALLVIVACQCNKATAKEEKKQLHEMTCKELSYHILLLDLQSDYKDNDMKLLVAFQFYDHKYCQNWINLVLKEYNED